VSISDVECTHYLLFVIIRIFLAFSNFMEMHGLMANYTIGLLTMKVCDSMLTTHKSTSDK
jgi:hypothetical protein